jgi:hypothetical protein
VSTHLPKVTRADFSNPNETIFHVPAGAQPDSHGRIRFTAYWLTDQPWKPGGVSGQVFNADLHRHLAQAAALGHPTRVIYGAAVAR